MQKNALSSQFHNPSVKGGWQAATALSTPHASAAFTRATDASGPGRDALAAGSLALAYGETGCGKTFIVLDLSLHMALRWRKPPLQAPKFAGDFGYWTVILSSSMKARMLSSKLLSATNPKPFA